MRRFYTIWAIMLLVSYAWIGIQFADGCSYSIIVCPSRLLYGVPCPGCGTTRALMKLLDGQVVEALRININVIIAATVLAGSPVVMIADMITGRGIGLRIWQTFELCMKKRIVFAIFIAMEFVIWMNNINQLS